MCHLHLYVHMQMTHACASSAWALRMQMLSTVQELKQLGLVSPAPFSKQEVQHLSTLVDLKGASGEGSSNEASPFGSPVASSRLAHRRGSVLAPLAAGRRGSIIPPRGSMMLSSSVQQAAAARRGSVFAGTAGGGGGSGAAPPREKLQMIPLEQTLRAVADIYQKKLKDDNLADSKAKLRVPMVKFVRTYLMRQYAGGGRESMNP